MLGNSKEMTNDKLSERKYQAAPRRASMSMYDYCQLRNRQPSVRSSTLVLSSRMSTFETFGKDHLSPQNSQISTQYGQIATNYAENENGLLKKKGVARLPQESNVHNQYNIVI